MYYVSHLIISIIYIYIIAIFFCITNKIWLIANHCSIAQHKIVLFVISKACNLIQAFVIVYDLCPMIKIERKSLRPFTIITGRPSPNDGGTGQIARNRRDNVIRENPIFLGKKNDLHKPFTGNGETVLRRVKGARTRSSRRRHASEICYVKIWGNREKARNVAPSSRRVFGKIRAAAAASTRREISFRTDSRERKRINTRQVLLLLGRRRFVERSLSLPSSRTRLISLVVHLDYVAATNQ